MANDQTTTIQELKDVVIQFREERGWGRHHTPRNLATSIVVEAAELIEHFQWGEYSNNDKQAITDELADIVIYAVNLAYTLDADLASACLDKLERAKQKFPTDIFNPGHDDKAAYERIKREYRGRKPPKKSRA